MIRERMNNVLRENPNYLIVYVEDSSLWGKIHGFEFECADLIESIYKVEDPLSAEVYGLSSGFAQTDDGKDIQFTLKKRKSS